MIHLYEAPVFSRSPGNAKWSRSAPGTIPAADRQVFEYLTERRNEVCENTLEHLGFIVRPYARFVEKQPEIKEGIARAYLGHLLDKRLAAVTISAMMKQ